MLRQKVAFCLWGGACIVKLPYKQYFCFKHENPENPKNMYLVEARLFP